MTQIEQMTTDYQIDNKIYQFDNLYHLVLQSQKLGQRFFCIFANKIN